MGQNYYTVTTDLWISCGRHPIMSFNFNWQLKTFCFDTVPVLVDHNGQNLPDAVQDIMENYELYSAMGTIDNGSNCVSAFTIVE